MTLPWEDVLTWLDDKLNGGEPGLLARLLGRIRRFEATLKGALDLGPHDERRRYVDPDLWAPWDLEALFRAMVRQRSVPADRLGRFMDCLMDIKFKLYCLLEADLPAYALAIGHYGLDELHPAETPHGMAIRLSSQATITVKVRSIWESVMNAAYAAEGVAEGS